MTHGNCEYVLVHEHIYLQVFIIKIIDLYPDPSDISYRRLLLSSTCQNVKLAPKNDKSLIRPTKN